MKRTHTCGALTKEDAGKTIILNGWIHRLRDHGEITFINLRDRYGITQIIVEDDAPSETREIARSLKMEYTVAVEGTVRTRPDSMVNPDMTTGAVEVVAARIEVLGQCETLPFMIDEESSAREDLRLQYRYLDMRSFGMQKRIQLRHKVSWAVREFLNSQDFLEIETPTLIKSTPEGARDFLVPSRLHPGKMFALPQSPQLYKQILMCSGFDKYFQIARCYRDEDARGDRQLEFTQVDMEMSFVSREDVFAVTEKMFAHVFKKTMDIELPLPFPRLSYDDAMNRYGSDKPELRFGMELIDFNDLAAQTDFKVFTSVVESGGAVKVLNAKGCAADYSRKKITELEDHAKTYGAKGLAWTKVAAKEGQLVLEGGIGRFLEGVTPQTLELLEAQEGDLLLFMAADWKTSCTALGAVRSRLGRDRGLIQPGTFNFCWIIDFPLFEWNGDEEKWEPAHHMFSMPQAQYLDTMEADPGAVKGDLYDLVCNGYELASGSIRCHDPAIQSRIFNIVGFPEEEAEERFGFLLKAFRYGAPPHGGIAPGLDRLLMIMAEKDSIKEVIPFPKNSAGLSPMDDCPAAVDAEQLSDLSLAFTTAEDSEQKEKEE